MGLFVNTLLLFIFTPSANTQPRQEVLTPLAPSSSDTPPPLNFSSPSPLIFHATFSLLQQWANSFFPNGHTIASCTIPRNTNLYHAHQNSSFPDSPEWFAFDAAMAYAILGSLVDSHMLTFRTNREVKCIYFDGTSAALMQDGSMDSQMVLLHNNSANVPDRPRWGRPPRSPPYEYGHHPPPRPNPYYGPPGGNWSHWNPLTAEYDRATGLCDFIKEKNLGGPGWGYEGIVRMNAAFELIWCNFTSPSADLVSWLDVSAPRLDGIRDMWETSPSDNSTPSSPPRWGPWKPSFPFWQSSTLEWFRAATSVYGFHGGNPGKGEARVKVNSCGIFTFYDPALTGQSSARMQKERNRFNLTNDGVWIPPKDEEYKRKGLEILARRRRYQRANNVSVSDGLFMRSGVETRLRSALSPSNCTGIDWVFITQTIVTDYSAILWELDFLLNRNTSSNATEVRTWLTTLRSTAHHLVMPYYEYPPLPIDKENLSDAFSMSAPQSQAALERCTSQHSPFDLSDFSTSEQLIHNSITDVLGELCGTVLSLFLAMEIFWLKSFNNVQDYTDTLSPAVQRVVIATKEHHREEIALLMAWLGWSEQWTICSPGCQLGEFCAIPTWPVLNGFRSEEDEEDLFWRPKCISGEEYDGRL